MFLCVDVYYQKKRATAAGVVFDEISSNKITNEYVIHVDQVAPYVSGQFYRRELPVIMTLIKKIDCDIHTIIIDGYVWLSSETQPGLGGKLYADLNGKIPVIGVAKRPYRDSAITRKVFRGKSRTPLYVTAVGMNSEQAVQLIKAMHGAHRLPTLLKYVDRLSRKST